MNIRLRKMTKDLCRAYHQQFEFDPVMFLDTSSITTYHYTPEHADAYWKRQIDLNREHLAIMLDDRVIGDIVLKNFDRLKSCCTMGIHLVNDSVKDKGYGTKAEILALQHAFDELGVDTVFADALIKNKRSQHVLQKVGFTQTHADETFIYYRCDKGVWQVRERHCKSLEAVCNDAETLV